MIARVALRFAALVLVACAVAACASPPPRAPYVPRVPKAEDALDADPDLLVVVRPRALSRDPLYGPLFRRASVLAATKGNAASVGTTALAAFERADEMLVAAYDRGGRDAVVAVRGVPADIDAGALVDTAGVPLWQRVHEENGITELVPNDPKADAALFVLPMRVWVIAIGDAVLRATAVYMHRSVPQENQGRLTLDVDPAALVVVQLRGDAMARHEPRLRSGPLAPIGRSLDRVEIALDAGAKGGAIGEWSGRFFYGADDNAAGAETRMKDVLGAFSRKYGETMRWVDDIHVTRAARAVTVRGRLPKPWVEGLLEAGGAPLE